MELTWRSTEGARTGWCNGFHVAQVQRSQRGWAPFVRHDHIPGPRHYDTPEEAMAAVEAAVEAAVADEPPPTPKPPAERRRFVPNAPVWVPPHRGTVAARKR